MILLLVLVVLLPWSVWRQMRPHEVTARGLIKLPLCFAAIGLLASYGVAVPDQAGVLAYLAAGLVLSTTIGALRGALIPTWRDGADHWHSQGNRVTIGLWGTLLGLKVALATVAHIAGSLPPETVGEIFLFLGVSFAVQNLVVARRTLLRRDEMVIVTT